MRGVLVAAVTGTLLAGAAMADTPTSVLLDPARPGVELLSLAGNSPVLREASWTWDEVRPCMVMHVRVRGPFAQVEIATDGLGRTRLAAVSNPERACQFRHRLDWRDRLTLRWSGLPDIHDFAFAVEADDTQLSEPGVTIEGRIVALAQGLGMVSVPLKVERLPLATWITAVAWAIGVVVPAGLAFFAGRQADRWNERHKAAADEAKQHADQVEAFAVWRQDPGARDSINEVLTEIDGLIATPNYVRPCARVLDTMYGKGMLAAMPPEARRRLTDICTGERPNALLDTLSELFPEVQSRIPRQWS